MLMSAVHIRPPAKRYVGLILAPRTPDTNLQHTHSVHVCEAPPQPAPSIPAYPTPRHAGSHAARICVRVTCQQAQLAALEETGVATCGRSQRSTPIAASGTHFDIPYAIGNTDVIAPTMVMSMPRLGSATMTGAVYVRLLRVR
eukprot:354857-Chlamydomonas_euryale.AAC.18